MDCVVLLMLTNTVLLYCVTLLLYCVTLLLQANPLLLYHVALLSVLPLLPSAKASLVILANGDGVGMRPT